MIVVFPSIIPNGYKAMALYPFIFVSEPKGTYVFKLLSKGLEYSKAVGRWERMIAHERVHHKQQKELLFIGFLLVYLYFHLRYGYRHNPMEKEAVHGRKKRFGWTEYI